MNPLPLTHGAAGDPPTGRHNYCAPHETGRGNPFTPHEL